MKKRQKILLVATLIILAVAGVTTTLYILNKKQNGKAPRCTTTDWEQNNCVPAGRCTPPGNPLEATIDCDIKKYDHKFIYTTEH